MKQLNIEDKPKISYCVSLELRDEQIKINCRKVKDRLEPSDVLINEPIALVSFGPSLNDTWEQLRNYKHIMTCSGAHKFLIEKGIIPTYHADLDPRIYKKDILGQPHHAVQYLIASTIHPKYLDALEGYNVKLWHIFASDEEAERVLPRGEWKFTGGSSIGLRTFNLARALGFTDLHVFGMDGSMRPNETHTTKHPNPPPQSAETEYKGKKYLTTPSMLHVAKETIKEMDQLYDCKFTFYGEGLVQDMVKDYVPNKKRGADLAYNSPETISKEYIELNRKLHEENPSYGMGGSKYKDTVLKMSEHPDIKSILDYGCGKSQLAKSLPFPIWEYDPAILEKSEVPKPADLVVCTDVLEHIEPDKLNFVLSDLKRVTKQIGYFVISTRKAVKTYSNGQNAHLIVQGKEWWDKKLGKFFNIGSSIHKDKECELHVVVSPKTEPKPEITIVEKDGYKFSFYTPNDTTKWRANTLFTKEPSTIEWLDSIKAGETLFDIGANVGSYTVYAGVRGVKVYSFEPEAENYAMLVKNMTLNGIKENAYCLALSNESKIDMLNLSQRGLGGSCHSFGGEEKRATQGCIGIRLSELFTIGLPVPDHVKIDVDGNELKVVQGFGTYLGEIKSIIVEIDPTSSEHKTLIELLRENGFKYDQNQVDKATRKEGNFKGYAEYVFVNNSEKEKYELMLPTDAPYPHTIIHNVFPSDVYDKIQKELPLLEYESLEEARGTKGYPERFVAELKPGFAGNIALYIENLAEDLCESFGLNRGDLIADAFFLKDLPGYKIGVHRDRLDKVVSALIYLPKDRTHLHAGTSIYKPKKEGFTCPIGKHYGFEEFDKVETISYEPNTCFAFLNTDRSFHGVEPCDVERNILLLNLNKKK